MNIFFAFLITIVLAIAGYHLTFRPLKLPIGTRRFYLTGIEFLLLGTFLGPQFLDILSRQTLKELGPLTILLLGWIGMLYGVQFEIPKLKRIPKIFFLSAGLESSLTAVIVFFGMVYTLPLFIEIPETSRMPFLLIIAAASAATAQTGIALRRPDASNRHKKTITLLRYVSSINGLTAIFLLGTAFLLRNTLISDHLLLPEKITAFVFPLFTLIIFLFLYLLFLTHRKQESELALVVIGMTIFTSGAAMVLNFSPLFANFLLGVCLVNLTRDKERIFRLLISVEKPVYLLLLVFLGANLILPAAWGFGIILLYFSFRTAGKLLGGGLIRRIQTKNSPVPPYLGLGLLEQGGLLSHDMVDQLRLTDNLALSFIALTAGGSLRIQSLKDRFMPIASTIFMQIVFIFLLVFLFVQAAGRYFSLFSQLPTMHLLVLGILLGVISIARSPSSTIAVIKECRSKGPFTETVLGVTVVIDVLIILLFTFALAVSKAIISENTRIDLSLFSGLFLEMFLSLLLGALLGKLIALFMERVGHDLLLFLLFIAFGVTRTSLWISHYMAAHFHIALHLEPLLICMSAGFFVQNFSRSGPLFIEYLDKMALPIFVLFFSLAGAALNLDSLAACWPIALCITGIRIIGIFAGSFLAGKAAKDPPGFCRNSWMAYLTQAGVAIGLAQLAGRQFPEIANYLNTVVLAVIAINQLIGPVFFKWVLDRIGESDAAG